MSEPKKPRRTVSSRKTVDAGDAVSVTHPVDLGDEKPTGVKLTQNLIQRLRLQQARTGVAIATQIRRLVAQGLDEIENPQVKPADLDRAFVLAGAKIAFDEETSHLITQKLEESGQTASEFVREAVLEKLTPRLVKNSETGTDQMRVKFLAKPPCGPWREAVDVASEFVISSDVAQTLEATDTDLMMLADGDSMEGVGIPDGSMLMMRPLSPYAQPRRGEVVCVQAFNDENECVSTVKTWIKSEPEVLLHDGNGQKIDFPAGTVRVVPVAVARAVLHRI